MSHGVGVGVGGQKSAKKCHVLFEWPLTKQVFFKLFEKKFVLLLMDDISIKPPDTGTSPLNDTK
jgi:hypothetical protein